MKTYRVACGDKVFFVDADTEFEAMKQVEAKTNEELTREEEKAIEDYKNAIKGTKDVKLLKLYAHILKEEIEHLEELHNEDIDDAAGRAFTKAEAEQALRDLASKWQQEYQNTYQPGTLRIEPWRDGYQITTESLRYDISDLQKHFKDKYLISKTVAIHA